MDTYLISVIMPTYNRSYIIKNAIQSVLAQTISNWELIIIDDASTDDTEKIIKRYEDSRIVYVKNKKNMGANYSRNRGCMCAKGQFLAFLDSDNIWRKDKLEKQLKSLVDSGDDIAFTFCRVEVLDEKKEKYFVPDLYFDIHTLKDIIRKKSVIDTNAVMIKKTIFNEVGTFDNSMPRLQDWEFFFRIIVVYQYKAIYIPEILDYNAIQPNSISTDIYKFQKAIIRFLKKYNEYLKPDEIVYYFLCMINNAKNKQESSDCINEFIKSLDIGFEEIYRVLAQKFYYQAKCKQILLSWKRNMEISDQRTIFISDFDYKWGDMTIALYGLGQFGDLVYTEMKNCGIKITYGIDKRVKIFHDLNVIKIQEIPESVDLIIVSVIDEVDKICDELSQYYSGKILSLEELVSDVRFVSQ